MVGMIRESMMDTLGTIVPQSAAGAQTEHRTEALERLRYLVHAGTCGLVTGAPGTGKTWCLRELATQLRREGISVALMNLAAVSAQEFPWLVAAKLGSGLTANSDQAACWMWLQEYAESSRGSRRRMTFLIDHIEHAEDFVVAPLRRLLDAFGESCSWIFAARDPVPLAWNSFLSEHSWLRVEMQRLAERESLQILSRNLIQRGCSARFTPQGITAAQQLAQGKIGRLQRLAELASLACEAEGVTQIDEEMVRSLATELA